MRTSRSGARTCFVVVVVVRAKGDKGVNAHVCAHAFFSGPEVICVYVNSHRTLVRLVVAGQP